MHHHIKAMKGRRDQSSLETVIFVFAFRRITVIKTNGKDIFVSIYAV